MGECDLSDMSVCECESPCNAYKGDCARVTVQG